MFKRVHGALVHDRFAIGRFHAYVERRDGYTVEDILPRNIHAASQQEVVDLKARDLINGSR